MLPFVKLIVFYLIIISTDSGRFSHVGSSKQHTARLAGGKSILKRFEADPNILQVIEEGNLLSKVHCQSNASTWYYVSMQSSYCDCAELVLTNRA